MRVLALAASMALLAQPVLAAEVVPDKVIELPRTGKWVLGLDPESCSIGASFGEGNGQVVLRLRRYDQGDQFDVELIGKKLDVGGTGPRESPRKIWFGFGAADPQEVPFSKIWSATMNTLHISNMGIVISAGNGGGGAIPVTPEQEAAATTVSFSDVSGQRLSLATGSMAPPLAALRSCTSDMIRSWGFDPALGPNLRDKPSPLSDPHDWWPWGDLASRSLGVASKGIYASGDFASHITHAPVLIGLQFRMDVDASGHVTACYVQASFGEPTNDKTVCGYLRAKAKFTPAHDAEGRGVKWYYIGDISRSARWPHPLRISVPAPR